MTAYPQQPTTDTQDLASAIVEFECALPGWWWSVGTCSVSRDASCGPDRAGPDADLLTRREFDGGFHCDGKGDTWTCAMSLRDVMAQSVEARGADWFDGGWDGECQDRIGGG